MSFVIVYLIIAVIATIFLYNLSNKQETIFVRIIGSIILAMGWPFVLFYFIRKSI